MRITVWLTVRRITGFKGEEDDDEKREKKTNRALALTTFKFSEWFYQQGNSHWVDPNSSNYVHRPSCSYRLYVRVGPGNCYITVHTDWRQTQNGGCSTHDVHVSPNRDKCLTEIKNRWLAAVQQKNQPNRHTYNCNEDICQAQINNEIPRYPPSRALFINS